jgi:hypothetical protein
LGGLYYTYLLAKWSVCDLHNLLLWEQLQHQLLLMATKVSPTQRSLAHLRELGYHVEVVEKWNSFTKQRKDLWGWADLLAIKKGEVLAVQVTASAVSDRLKKIMASDTLAFVRDAGIRIEVHGWRKSAKTNKYVLRIEDIS